MDTTLALSVLIRGYRPPLAKTPLVADLPIPSCHLLPVSFKGSASLCRWCLGITGMTAMGTRWVTLRFPGWVWYMLLQHTWALKEMSARLYRRWWQTLRWIPTHRLGEINEFLKETFPLLGFLLLLSTSSKLLFLSFHTFLSLPLLFDSFAPCCLSLPFIHPYRSLSSRLLLHQFIFKLFTTYKIMLGNKLF